MNIGAVAKPNRRRQFIALLLFIAVLTTVALAIVGEFVVRHRERHRIRPPDFLPTLYYPHSRIRTGIVPNADYYGWVKTNSLGFRGGPTSLAKPPGTLRILCLGGSTTFDIANLSEEHSWPQVMRKNLAVRFPSMRVEVLNMGIPGATSLDSLIDLQIRGLELEPDIVVLYQGHNDFRYTIDPPRVPVHKNNLLPDEQPPRSVLVRWLQRNSLLYGKAIVRVRAMVSSLATSIGLKALRNVTPEERVARIRDGVAEFRSNVRSLVAIAQSEDIRVVLPHVVFPAPLPAEAEQECVVCAEMTSGRGYRGVSAEMILAGYAEYARVIEEEARVTGGVTTVHTAGWVPSKDDYYADPVHFAREGSVIFGTRMAEALTPVVQEIVSR